MSSSCVVELEVSLRAARPTAGSSYFSIRRLGVKVPWQRRFFKITKTILAINIEVDLYCDNTVSHQSMVVRVSRVQRYLTAVVGRSR